MEWYTNYENASAIALPAQFCMVCLNVNMECRLYPMKKYNLDWKFEKLTGISLQGVMPFEPQLCAECAQRLSNCGKFYNQSLRAYQLLIELVDNHQTLTTQIIKVIDRKTLKLESNISKKVFQPNHFDLHLIDLIDDIQKNISVVYLKNTDKNEAEKKIAHEDTELTIDIKREVQLFDNDVIDILMNETGNELLQEVTKGEAENFNNNAFDDVTDILVNENDSELQESIETVLDANREAGNFNDDAFDDVIDIAGKDSDSELQNKGNDCVNDADSLDYDIDIDYCDDTDYFNCDIYGNKLTNEVHTKENLVERCVREKTAFPSLDYYIDVNDCDETDTINENKTINNFTNEVHTKKKVVTKGIRKKKENFTNKVDSKEKVVTKGVRKKKGNFTKEVVSKEKGVKKRIKKRNRLSTGPVHKVNLKLFEEIQLTEVDQLAEIENKKESNNYKNATYKCSLCFEGYIDLEAYMSHMDKHSENFGPLECAICHLRFKIRRNLIRHIKNKHQIKYKCIKCHFVSNNRGVVIQHERWHQGKTYKCQHCGEQFTKCSSHLSHVRIKHPSDSVCAQCGFSFVGERGLRFHMIRKHKLVDGTQNLNGPTCELCQIHFASETAYKQHLVVSPKHASPDQPRRNNPQKHMYCKPAVASICELCGKHFRRRNHLMKHFKSMHPHRKMQKVLLEMCEKCGKLFKCAAVLQEHMQVHTGKKLYKCDICGKGFMSKGALKCHIDRHSDKLACSVCHKQSSNPANLARHMPTHLCVRPSYKCEYCGKSYTSIPGRDQHVSHVHHHVPWPKKINGKWHRVKARRRSIHSD